MAGENVQYQCDVELQKLTQKLQEQLGRDIARIYRESLFCDLELVLDNISIHANRCILQVRATRFYSQLCSVQQANLSICELDFTSIECIKNFVRDVYSKKDISEAESLVVRRLQKVTEKSPESDVFVTPKCSPSEIIATGEKGHCGYDANPSYYSLVHLDDISIEYDTFDPQSLEIELAEQEILLQTFHSIRRKEENKAREKKLTYPCSEQSFKKREGSEILSNLKKAVEEDCRLLNEDLSLVATCNKVDNSRNQPNLQEKFKLRFLSNRKEDCHIENDAVQNCGFYDAEDRLTFSMHDVGSVMENRKNNQSSLIFEMDAGPDSGLATSTTWGTNDHTISETSGGDLTEDIPHDPEFNLEATKSVSSSLSSDCETWEPPDGGTQQLNSLGSWVESAPHPDNTEVNADFVDRVLEELVEKSRAQSREENHKENTTHSDLVDCNNSLDDAGALPVARQNFFIDAASLLDETEVLHAGSTPIKNGSELQNYDRGNLKESECKTDEEENFIEVCRDISTDSEGCKNVASTALESVETLNLVDDKEISRDPSHEDDCKHVQTLENDVAADGSDTGFEDSVTTDHTDTAPEDGLKEDDKPQSLIRSNTFELEAEDDRLALLRQEYERRQGNMLFQSCILQNSGPLSDGSSEQEQNQHYTSLTSTGGHESLGSQYGPFNSMPVLPPYLVEEDIHSPDSLNNDGPDALFQEKLALSRQRMKLEQEIHGNVCKVSEKENVDVDRDGKNVTEQSKIVTEETINEKHEEDVDSSKSSLNRIECTPIVSGGVAAKDFSTPPKELQSPMFSRRRTECAPILSGAAPPLSPDPRPVHDRPKPANISNLSSAWVVDISDITKSPESRRKHRSDSNVILGSDLQVVEFKDQPALSDQHSLSQSESRCSSSGLGFFIDLKDSKPAQEEHSTNDQVRSGKNCSQHLEDFGKMDKQNACEFFVDLKQSGPEKEEPRRHSLGATKVIHSPEKKLFSMFIDIGDQVAPKAKPELTSRLKAPNSPFSSNRKNLMPSNSSQSVSQCDREEPLLNQTSRPVSKNLITFRDTCQPQQQSAESGDSSESKKNSFFMFIETESPVSKRKPLTSSLRPPSNRHLLTTDQSEKSLLKKQHHRAHSLSLAKNSSIQDVSLSSNTSQHLSSQSLCNSDSSVDAMGSCFDTSVAKPMFSSCHASLSIRDKSVENSSVEIEKSPEDNSPCISQADPNGQDSMESSVCSTGTYSIHTPGNSTATDDFSCKVKHKRPYMKHQNSAACKSTHTRDRLSSKPGSIGLISEVGFEEKQKPKRENEGSFVRLSDLDREPVKSQEDIPPVAVQRMSRSIPETSWIESKLLMTRSTGGSSAMTNSSRSLSRLFPHLTTSGGSIGRSKTPSSCSPAGEDIDAMRSSEISEISSMQSSLGLEYSTESTDISSGRGGPTAQLGDDLLKMFLEEINPDVIVEVGGRRIKAHKCILSSRCQYFAAILSGGWVESAGNVISLQGFSYNSVHFALCHIYSGASTIPDHISIVELATLADMLCLEGLKEVIMYTLKVKYCHFFHKPCAVCSVGVLECLPLAAAYGLDDIYHKSLRWITKYFVRIWCTKAFATLPRELVDKCYQQHVVHMSEENVLETVMCCDKLLATIPSVRWAEPIFALTSRLAEACIKFMADNFSTVLTSESFLSLGRELPWNVSRVQESLSSAADRLPPDQSCRSYTQLHSILKIAQGPDPPPEMSWHPNFLDLLLRLRDQAEHSLIRQAPRAARTRGWNQMPSELRRKIQDAACLVLAPADHSNQRYKRCSSDGSAYSGQRSNHSRSLDLRQVKIAMVQHARRTMSASNEHQHVPVVVRKKPDQPTVVRRSAQVISSSTSSSSRAAVPREKSLPSKEQFVVPTTAPPQGRPKTWPAQVKSRYLEQRPSRAKQVSDRSASTAAPVPQRRSTGTVKSKFISSSDSSRNSSPAMRRSGNASATSSARTSDAGSRSRAATIAGPGVHLNPIGPTRENEVSKSTDNLAKRSTSGFKNKKISSVRTPPVQRKPLDAMSPDSLCNGDRLSEGKSYEDTSQSCQQSSALGMQTVEVTLSDDSLATESSYNDDTRPSQEDQRESKHNSFEVTQGKKIALGAHSSADKKYEKNASRTPLSLTNKRALPLSAPKSSSLAISKLRNTSSLTMTKVASPPPRRSISHAPKSVAAPTNSSRLSLPLRASRSSSSVPEKIGSKVDNIPEIGAKKSSVRTQSRIQTLATPNRVTAGGKLPVKSSTNSSLAGRASISKSNKVNNNITKPTNCHSTTTNQENGATENVRPTVGPRSGTFLKDEPTVLKTPEVENAHE